MASFGLPLHCPRCEPGDFAMLKIPGRKTVPCPHCGARLVPIRRTRIPVVLLANIGDVTSEELMGFLDVRFRPAKGKAHERP